MNYSAQIKKIRKDLKISQEEIARKLGVSYITVNRWENGRTNPSPLAATKIEAFIKKVSGRK